MFDRAAKPIFILIALVVIATLIGPSVFGRVDDYKVATVDSNLTTISSAVESYKMRVNSYPDSLGVLIDSGDLVGVTEDPWGRKHKYSTVQPNVTSKELPYYVWSLGRDGHMGGDGINQDRGNW